MPENRRSRREDAAPGALGKEKAAGLSAHQKCRPVAGVAAGALASAIPESQARFRLEDAGRAVQLSGIRPMNADHRFDAFLMEMAKSLHTAGAPAHDIERAVGRLGEIAGVSAQCFSLPTQVSIAITEPTGDQRVRLRRMPPSDYNMSRLIALEKIVEDFAGPESIDGAEASLKQILDTPPPWTGLALIFGVGLLSASVAVLFGGGWTEMLCGGLLGMVFVTAYIRLSRRAQFGPVAPVLLCALVAFLAKALLPAFPNQTVFITILSGIVLLLPGFTTTIALSELATMNLLSGSGRLAGAFILTLMMGAGVAIGSTLGDILIHPPTGGVTTAVPVWAFRLGVAGLGASFLAVLQAPLRAMPVAVAATLLACVVSMGVAAHYGDIAAAFVASFTVAYAGHLYQRLTGRPAALIQVPGLLTLVPGSVGFRGLSALIEQNFLEGIKITSGMVLTATALAVGTLLANGLRPLPKQKTAAGKKA